MGNKNICTSTIDIDMMLLKCKPKYTITSNNKRISSIISLVDTIIAHKYKETFINELLTLTIDNKEQQFTIKNVDILQKKPWKEIILNMILSDNINVFFKISNDIYSNISIKINTLILINCINVNNTILEIYNYYPKIVSDKAYYKNKWRKVSYIQILECPKIYLSYNTIIKNECIHKIYIYFIDGTIINNGPKVKLENLQNLGYIPYIKQYRPNDEKLYEEQLKLCDISKKIGSNNIYTFVYHNIN